MPAAELNGRCLDYVLSKNSSRVSRMIAYDESDIILLLLAEARIRGSIAKS
jgi:hypothetical protein